MKISKIDWFPMVDDSLVEDLSSRFVSLDVSGDGSLVFENATIEKRGSVIVVTTVHTVCADKKCFRKYEVDEVTDDRPVILLERLPGLDPVICRALSCSGKSFRRVV